MPLEKPLITLMLPRSSRATLHQAKTVRGLCLLSALLALRPSNAANGEIEILTEELPWAVIDRPYAPAPLEVRVTGRCPAGGVGFAVVSGTLPPGVRLSRLGYLSGIPKQTGLFEFNVRAVNGCSWTARRYSLLVTEPPKLKAAPETLSVDSPKGVNPPPATIHLTATWPSLPYAATLMFAPGPDKWLKAVPLHGLTSRESVPRQLQEAPSDEVGLEFSAAGLKPGKYEAQVVLSAWQANPVSVPVVLTVE